MTELLENLEALKRGKSFRVSSHLQHVFEMNITFFTFLFKLDKQSSIVCS